MFTTYMQMHMYSISAFIILTCMGDLSTNLVEDGSINWRRHRSWSFHGRQLLFDYESIVRHFVETSQNCSEPISSSLAHFTPTILAHCFPGKCQAHFFLWVSALILFYVGYSLPCRNPNGQISLPSWLQFHLPI